MARPLRLIREKPAEAKSEKTHDANDILTSVPNARAEQREPTAEEKKKITRNDYRKKKNDSHQKKA